MHTFRSVSRSGPPSGLSLLREGLSPPPHQDLPSDVIVGGSPLNPLSGIRHFKLLFHFLFLFVQWGVLIRFAPWSAAWGVSVIGSRTQDGFCPRARSCYFCFKRATSRDGPLGLCAGYAAQASLMAPWNGGSGINRFDFRWGLQSNSKSCS